MARAPGNGVAASTVTCQSPTSTQASLAKICPPKMTGGPGGSFTGPGGSKNSMPAAVRRTGRLVVQTKHERIRGKSTCRSSEAETKLTRILPDAGVTRNERDGERILAGRRRQRRDIDLFVQRPNYGSIQPKPPKLRRARQVRNFRGAGCWKFIVRSICNGTARAGGGLAVTAATTLSARKCRKSRPCQHPPDNFCRVQAWNVFAVLRISPSDSLMMATDFFGSQNTDVCGRRHCRQSLRFQNHHKERHT